MVLMLTAVVLLLYAALILFYYREWKALPEYRPQPTTRQATLSLIIPARNEEKNIAQLLHALQEQSYPTQCFEVIVVDDHSTDATAMIAQASTLSNIRVIQPTVPAEASSKKKAIEAGIALAKGELIVTTDADCHPGPQWLQTINAFYQEHHSAFIAAPVQFTHDGSALQLFQSLDFLTLQGITAASVAAQFHTMCNGANLAYRKEAFHEVKGFSGIDHIASGDDMLLMYKIWKKHPEKVHYLKSREAIVTTAPMPTWKAFFMQRKRWASKTLVYDDARIIAVLGFVLIVNLFFPFLLIWAMIHGEALWYPLLFWIGKTLIEWPFLSSIASFYGQRNLFLPFLLLQPLHMLYTVGVGLWSQVGGYEWKARKMK